MHPRSHWRSAVTLIKDANASPSAEDLVRALLGRVEILDPDSLAMAVSDSAVQQLLTVAVKLYASKLEDEVVLFPFTGDDVLTPTEVGMTVGHMIKAADIDLFELVSWQSLRGN